ncbi:MAG: ATP-dependent DNA helicase RecG [Elusimicrobia bacterium]|nr:ATP-dependent DNA helicase RecG [Elusimicrobiota bacterium]
MVKLSLDNPIQYFKGVGPRRALSFQNLGILTVEDLLHHFPREWQDRRQTKDLSFPTASGLTVVKGRVLKARLIPAGPRLALYKATLSTGESRVEAVWFKHLSPRFDVFASLKKEAAPGEDIWLVGRGESQLLDTREIKVEEHYPALEEKSLLHVDRLTPIYSLTEGLTQRFLRELVHKALQEAGPSAAEILPRRLLEKRALLAAPQALRAVHFPESQAELEAARERLAYEEFLLLELAWTLKRRQTNALKKSFGYTLRKNLLTPFKERLGFHFTLAQKRVINEIFADMQKPSPMTRLLQGDVGSGKTVVALASLLLAVENGFQGAFMAPTEILAEQHFATIQKFLKGLPVKTALLTSRLKAKEREKILSELSAGKIQILAGTHALLEEDVLFSRLRLAVIDEQHRFGVRQRATLRRKNSLLDLLVMTATPIPRTLALALYGDLDVSTLDEMPPGKTPAETVLAAEGEAFERVRREAALGRQAYVVYPIIEESRRLDLRSAKAEFARLKQDIFPDLKVALLHGAMPSREKNKVMAEFAAGAWQVLAATQVIEVGIDVPNATVMVIQNAERFGLASLHQLRGRIGRGQAPSKCFLVADPKTPEARKRLETMAAVHDGFRIGEEDLKLRGPGEMLGTAQHGELALKVADIFKDSALLARAKQDAEELLAQDPRLQDLSCRSLRERLIALYQRRWDWVDLS